MNRTIAAATTMLLVGCATGPRYVRPTAEVPSAYKSVPAVNPEHAWAKGVSTPKPAPGFKAAVPRDEQSRGAWWAVFQDRQLDSLEARVAVSNQTVRKWVAMLVQARAVAGQARALYYPTLSAGASVVPGHTSGNVSGSLPGQTVTDYSMGLTASWEPDLFDKIGHAVDAATARAQASAADLAAVQLSVQAELAVDYFDLRQVDAQSALLQQNLDTYAKALELVQQRLGAGVASDYDLAQARTQLESTRAQLVDLGVLRAVLEHAIATLIGVPASEFSLAPDPTQLAPPLIPAGVPSELLERRPDIAAAERRLAASNADVGAAVSAFFPDLVLAATRGFESYSLANWLTLPSRFWAVAPQIAGTIFDGGARRQRLREAQANFDGSVADYRQLVLTSFQQVEDNLATLHILAKEAETERSAVQSAQQALDAAMNRYRGGAIDYLSVVTTQTIALDNERQATAIAGRRLDASVLLIKALGGSWDAPS